MEEIVDRKSWVVDIETLINCFTLTSINIDTGEVKQFGIWRDINQLDEIFKHLQQTKGQITFNGLNFDYPVIHFIIYNYVKMKGLSSDEITTLIYKEAQRIIQAEFSSIRDKEVLIKQLDLFRIWHFNNKARATSLKKLEVAMNLENVQDMPHHHGDPIETKEQYDEVMSYNLNDVIATKEFYYKTLDKIDLRKKLSKKYDIDFINYNNGKIGEQLLLKLYCDKVGANPWDVKKLRTYRSSINISECIFDYIKFKHDTFNKFLDKLRNTVITNTKASMDETIVYKGLAYDFGAGGLHAATKAGVYESKGKRIIKSLDVSSLYPSIAIVGKLFPQHLGEEFFQIYKEEIVDVRLGEKAKGKDGDKVIINGFKEAANIPYGKSNDVNSFIYDPLYTMKTTINGQLLLTMLCEELADIPGSEIIMVNTDGLEMIIDEDQQELYHEICKSWEKQTGLTLEFVDYKKVVLRDINNYSAMTMDGKIKYKGVFKTNEEMIKDGEWHKDFSMGIVAIALSDYFFKGVKVEETIYNNKDIFNFTKRSINTYGWRTELRYLDNSGEHGTLVKNKLGKINRYYMSTNGGRLYKIHDDGREQLIEATGKVTLFNKAFNNQMEEYKIDFQYYVQEVYKIIDIVENKQLSLF